MHDLSNFIFSRSKPDLCCCSDSASCWLSKPFQRRRTGSQSSALRKGDQNDSCPSDRTNDFRKRHVAFKDIRRGESLSVCFNQEHIFNNFVAKYRKKLFFMLIWKRFMGVDGCWCALWSSKPVRGVSSLLGGFDSHILPPLDLLVCGGRLLSAAILLMKRFTGEKR